MPKLTAKQQFQRDNPMFSPSKKSTIPACFSCNKPLSPDRLASRICDECCHTQEQTEFAELAHPLSSSPPLSPRSPPRTRAVAGMNTTEAEKEPEPMECSGEKPVLRRMPPYTPESNNNNNNNSSSSWYKCARCPREACSNCQCGAAVCEECVEIPETHGCMTPPAEKNDDKSFSRFVNLTPHAVHIWDQDKNKITRTFEPIGPPARMKETIIEHALEEGISIVQKEYGEATDLPAPRSNTIFIVSEQVCRAHHSDRFDLVVPDTGPDSVVRDAKGVIVGVRRFFVI